MKERMIGYAISSLDSGLNDKYKYANEVKLNGRVTHFTFGEKPTVYYSVTSLLNAVQERGLGSGPITIVKVYDQEPEPVITRRYEEI